MDFALFRPRPVIPEFAKRLNCAKLRLKTNDVTVSVRTPGFAQWELIPFLVIDINSELFKAKYVGEEKRNTLIVKPLFTPFLIDVSVDPLNTQTMSVAAKSRIDISSDIPSGITCSGKFESAKRKGSLGIVLDATFDGLSCLLHSGVSGNLKVNDSSVFFGLAAGVPSFAAGFVTKANVSSMKNTFMARVNLPWLETRVCARLTESVRVEKVKTSGTAKYKNVWLRFASEPMNRLYNIEAGVDLGRQCLKLATDSDRFASANVDFHFESGKLGLWGGWNFEKKDRPRFGISFTARD